jgi:phosphohistidine swiveling domain-containing protein
MLIRESLRLLENNMQNQKESKYTFIWSDYQPNYTVETNINSLIKYSEIDWNKIENIIEISRDNKISTYHSEKDLKVDRERGKKLLEKDYFKKLIKEVEKVYDDCQGMFRELKNIDYSKLSNRELYDCFVRMTDMWSLMISYFRFSQAEGTHYLIEGIKKHASDENASLLMLSPELDTINLEQIDWQKLIKKPFSEDIIIEHIYKYPWLASVHFTLEDIIETLKQRYDYDKENLIEKDIRKEKQELREKQEKVLRENPKLRRLAEVSQRIALSRTEVKFCWAGTDWYFIPLFEEIAKRTKEEVHDLQKYYLIKEVRDLLLKKKKMSREEMEKRNKCFVGLWKNGKANYYSGDKAEEIAKQELGSLYKISKTNEFKGTSANPGKFSGIARILYAGNMENVREVRKSFKKGEILITEMTQPSIMDIASKAGAIVTDEGGMLSHAAIISRELKIPCIVGTHFATTLIENGDKIEINADKGIVKILKNK